MDIVPQPLTTHECTLLSAHEAQIERGLQTFYDVGTALLAIRDQRLYRATFATFEAYCRERWGLKRQRAYELIDAAVIMGDLSEISDKPIKESHAAPLAAVPPAERAEVWQEAVDTAPNGKVTAAHVQQVIDQRRDPEPIRVLHEPPPLPMVEPPEPAPRASHQQINQSTNNEWYTPARFVNAARQVMGRIDLDPASCAFANATVQATRFYTQADDGYRQPWHGAVWLNPPYGKEEGERDSNQARWTRRAIDAYRIGEIDQAIILVNAVPGNVWFSPLWAFPICMVARRIRFYNEETDEGQPTHSNAIIYLGPHLAAFIDVFSAFGPVVGRLGTADHKPLLALEEFTP
jgi:hypothetical protein